jgi:hypothetical protein
LPHVHCQHQGRSDLPNLWFHHALDRDRRVQSYLRPSSFHRYWLQPVWNWRYQLQNQVFPSRQGRKHDFRR